MMNYRGEIQSTSHFLRDGRDMCIDWSSTSNTGFSGPLPYPLAQGQIGQGYRPLSIVKVKFQRRESVQGLTNLISIFPQENRSISPGLELLPNVDAKQQEDWNFFLYHTFLTP